MSKLKYTYALDSTKTFLVHINNAIKGEVYYCPYSKCDEQFCIKNGNERRKHFSHTNNGKKCSYDNYLHSLAERRIAEWFNSASNITLGLNVDIHCLYYNDCIWKNNNRKAPNCCSRKRIRSFNLKDFYNCIEIEKREHGYIWDLWLTNNIKKYPPLAIEIYVTHECEVNKLNSGIRTIEIKLNSEEQLQTLINSNAIIENDNVIFYNFETKPLYEKCIGNLKLNKFILYENRKARFKVIDCNTFLKKEFKSIYELTFDFFAGNNTSEKVFNAFYLACAKASIKYQDFKHCSLCKYYKYNESYNQHICILYKQLKLEDKHAGTNALTCTKYNLNREFINESVKHLSQLSQVEWTKENK